MNEKAWIAVAYDLPSNPSRYKLRAWRKLKKAGGIYPNVSLCFLPDNAKTKNEVSRLCSWASKQGKFVILRCAPVDKRSKDILTKMFLEDRKKQCLELKEECREFINEVIENVRVGNVTQEEVDELESSYENLKSWFEQILRNGFVTSKDKKDISLLLKECEKALNEFAQRAQPKNVNVM